MCSPRRRLCWEIKVNFSKNKFFTCSFTKLIKRLSYHELPHLWITLYTSPANSTSLVYVRNCVEACRESLRQALKDVCNSSDTDEGNRIRLKFETSVREGIYTKRVERLTSRSYCWNWIIQNFHGRTKRDSRDLSSFGFLYAVWTPSCNWVKSIWGFRGLPRVCIFHANSSVSLKNIRHSENMILGSLFFFLNASFFLFGIFKGLHTFKIHTIRVTPYFQNFL